MRTLPIRLAAVALLAGLVLAGCHKKSAEQQLAADDATPVLAVQNAVKQLRAGHFDNLMQHLLPPADYARLRSDWKASQQRALAKLDDSDRQRFATQMAALTAPDAKDKEFAKLAPVLDAWEKKYQQQVPMVVGIVKLAVGTRITDSDTLTGAQKAQARGVLDAVATWAQGTDWGDKAKAREAVGIVVDTARALDLKTLDAVYQLDYAQAMARYGTAWNGAEQLLAVYGMPVDAMLDSIKVTSPKVTGDTATVQVDYAILDKPMTSTLDLVRQGQRWYLQGFLEQWHKSHALPAPAASAARPASTAPAAGASTH